MIDFIWHTFHVGLIEWLGLIELVVLLTFAFFYQVAKIIAKQDRHDPLVRFYRVFWRAFYTPVTSMRQLELREAEARAMAAGIVGVSDVSGADLDSLDPGDFFGDELDNVQPSQPMTRAIGRDAPMSEDLSAPIAPTPKSPKENAGRMKKETESREAKFIRQAREGTAPKTGGGAPPARQKAAVEEPVRAAVSTFNALIIPFADDDRLVGFKAGEVVVNVKCAPEDGSANGVIINTVAERLGLRPYQIVLLRGHYKVRKTLQVSGMDQKSLDRRLSEM